MAQSEIKKIIRQLKKKELTYGEIVNVKTEIKHGENKISAYHEIINEKEEVVALLETHWI